MSKTPPEEQFQIIKGIHHSVTLIEDFCCKIAMNSKLTANFITNYVVVVMICFVCPKSRGIMSKKHSEEQLQSSRAPIVRDHSEWHSA
jgi:sulfur relay (sulfurtransferase) complex TusBCD TusD component (DsrE family)